MLNNIKSKGPKLIDYSEYVENKNNRVIQDQHNQNNLEFKDKNGNQLWAVEAILKKKFLKGKLFYKVKWVGFPLNESTWEPLANLQNVRQLIDNFEYKLKEDKEKAKKAKKKSQKLAKSLKIKAENLKILQKNSKKIRKTPKILSNKYSKYIRKSYHTQTNKPMSNKDILIQKQGDFSVDICEKIGDHVILMTEREKQSLKSNITQGLKVSELYYRVDWKRKENGYQPGSVYFKGEILQKKIPKIYFEYLLNNVFVE